MEVLGLGEGLTDPGRPDELAVAFDEGSVGFVCEQPLGDPGDHQRIDEPGDDGEDEHHPEGGKKLTAHHDTPIAAMNRSMALMPMNGAMIPPSP